MSGSVWQDREIRFDSPDSQLQPRAGEVIISHLEEVEDTKGNSRDNGYLYVTNLRVIWTSATQGRVNLSIGLKTISKIQTKRVKSYLRGLSEAIHLMTTQNKTQFEFIFTSRVSDNTTMFSSVMAVHRAYLSSSLYREVAMRGALLADRELRLLPQEQLYNKVPHPALLPSHAPLLSLHIVLSSAPLLTSCPYSAAPPLLLSPLLCLLPPCLHSTLLLHSGCSLLSYGAVKGPGIIFFYRRDDAILIIFQIGGVWNLSSDKGNLGTLYITNVRVAWQCKLNDNFNVSIPYLQMKVVKVRDTKFGVAMVLEAGNLVLGFKVDPYETLKKIVKEIQSLHQVYSSSPIFGVEYSTADEWEGPTPPTTDTIQEDVELVGTKEDISSCESIFSNIFVLFIAAYLADPHKRKDREPVYSHELGLAIEALPDGYSISDLWQIS
ncbi:Bardet-Biedl syndrome 5 protein homolog [Geodia barretti]|uniref:BBSome complex member BBS5 n=1 Tax=Geodia barretti TaxID=519541 RepID=A0AA35RLW8_GEOBA|nr:Bardet-Biedl syndrome 5 protein homolog [Geodia barretti]